jgi:hypothetical protein
VTGGPLHYPVQPKNNPRQRGRQRGRNAGQYSLGKWITLLVKYRVISSSGKSVCSIFLVNTILPLPSSHVERSGSVGIHGELPDLKFLRGDCLVVGLNDRDLVEKPIRSAVLGNVLRAVGVENVAVDPMPIPISLPVNCARSLVLRVFVVIMCASFLEVAPRTGAREATKTAALKAQSHRQPWNK